LTREFQYKPKRIEVGVISTPVDLVKQHLYTVRTEDKTQLLYDVLDQPNVASSIVFIRTKYRADRVAKQLKRKGFKAQPIHGGRSQNQRQRALEDFKSGKCNILVATDVAARGIDIQGVTHVINFDIPGQYDDYVHRIGRTARAQEKGDAITFASPDNAKELGQIEKGLGRQIDEVKWDGAVEIPRSFRANAARGKGGKGQGKNNRNGAGGGNYRGGNKKRYGGQRNRSRAKAAS
ncbi:MAG: C-terminal helicase domain-containing protein, partial [Candidatus Hydrogenedentes bacterium]|nr:C-terminal helicase domain-containing protein [Candidatus Hydrogenedentota bacterium]